MRDLLLRLRSVWELEVSTAGFHAFIWCFSVIFTVLSISPRGKLSQITRSACWSSATYFGFGEKLSTNAPLNYNKRLHRLRLQSSRHFDVTNNKIDATVIDAFGFDIRHILQCSVFECAKSRIVSRKKTRHFATAREYRMLFGVVAQMWTGDKCVKFRLNTLRAGFFMSKLSVNLPILAG